MICCLCKSGTQINWAGRALGWRVRERQGREAGDWEREEGSRGRRGVSRVMEKGGNGERSCTPALPQCLPRSSESHCGFPGMLGCLSFAEFPSPSTSHVRQGSVSPTLQEEMTSSCHPPQPHHPPPPSSTVSREWVMMGLVPSHGRYAKSCENGVWECSEDFLACLKL